MATKGAYNRRGHGAWKPSDRQRQVLDFLVEGKSNAEIAIKLGISVDGAKWHVSELLGETGLEDRQDLARWWVEERRRSRRQSAVPPLPMLPTRAILAASALAVVVVILSAFLLWGPDSGGEAETPVAAAPAADVAPFPTPTQLSIAAGPPPPCDTPLPDGFRTVTADELRGRGLVELGQVIQPHTCPLRVSNRDDLALFWLADGGAIDPSRAGMHGVPGSLHFYHEGELFLPA